IPFWLRGCFLWTLFGVLLLTVAWWILHPQKWLERKKAEVHKTVPANQPKEKEKSNLSEKKQTKQDATTFFDSGHPHDDKTHETEIVSGAGRRGGSVNSGNRKTTNQVALKIKRKGTRQPNSTDGFSKNKNTVTKTRQPDNNKTDISSVQ